MGVPWLPFSFPRRGRLSAYPGPVWPPEPSPPHLLPGASMALGLVCPQCQVRPTYCPPSSHYACVSGVLSPPSTPQHSPQAGLAGTLREPDQRWLERKVRPQGREIITRQVVYAPGTLPGCIQSWGGLSSLGHTGWAFSTPQNTGGPRCCRAHTTHWATATLRCRHCWQDQEAAGWGAPLCCPQHAFWALAYSLGSSLSI